MPGRSTLLRLLVVVLVGPATVVVVSTGGWAATVAGGLIVLAGSVWVGLVRPGWYSRATVVVVGAAPMLVIPGVNIAALPALALAAFCAVFVHRTPVRGWTWIEGAVVCLIATSSVGFAFTVETRDDVIAFLYWMIGTLFVFALTRVGFDELRRVLTWFVVAVASGMTLALVQLIAVPSLFDRLGVFGAGASAGGQRLVLVGGEAYARLGGSYVDPNVAGIVAVSALMCVPVMAASMRVRVSVAALLVVATLLTLSRGAALSIVAAGLVLLAFHPLGRPARIALGSAFGLLACAAAATGAVRERVLSSFGSQDIGASQRLIALDRFPDDMSGHWWTGLGWGRPEFLDETAAYVTNVVANTPLLTVYRAGLLAGIAMVGLLMVGIVIAYRLVRARAAGSAAGGALFIGFVGVSLQVDYPVVTIPTTTMAFSIMLALIAAWDVELRSRETVSQQPDD